MKLAAINLEISKLSTKNIVEHSKIMSLHHMNDSYSLFKMDHDSSGDDTSSRGTLDSIIPPPANFQGKNNPFHLQSSSSQGTQKGNFSIANKLFNRHSLSKLATNCSSNVVKNQRISLPVSLNPVISPPVKPLKRQLSEKDLVIGPNGEVKRRRHRRPRKNQQNQLVTTKDGIITERQKTLRSSLGQDESNKQQAQASDNQQLNTCMEYTQNGRTLRQRQEKNYCDGRRGSTSSNNATISQANSANTTLNVSNNSNSATSACGVRTLNLSPQKMSPFKNQPSVNSADSIDDLKSSVHSYFGAANRIGSGEKFTLIGRRMTDSGNVQYLIEWDGHGS